MNSWIPNQNNNMVMGQAMFNPYNQQYSLPTTNMYQNKLPTYHAEPIHGENAAWQFAMGPNSEIYLPDADEDLIWWIRTDQNGNKNVIPFDVSPHQKKPEIDMNDLAARLAAVEEWINGKQNKSNAKRSVAVSANTTSGSEQIN